MGFGLREIALQRFRSFGSFFNERKATFRGILRNNIGQETMKDFLKESMEKCCSQFEEDTLIENLAEEYKLYLKELVA